jgi:hypothetical protein
VYSLRSEMPSTLKETPKLSYSYDDYVVELKSRMQLEHEIGRQKLVSGRVKAKIIMTKILSR